jgi:hypothetical protein
MQRCNMRSDILVDAVLPMDPYACDYRELMETRHPERYGFVLCECFDKVCWSSGVVPRRFS